MQGGISSQFGPGQLGSQTSRRSSGTGKFIQSDHSASGSSVYQGNTAYKRNQVGNANYLLNFHYNPIPRPTSRAPPPRRQRKIKPYNKDLFLQANYKFVVLDTGSYQVESMDPDKMLQWEDIICVRYSTPFTVKCPICLDTPLCPQITSCGHIYCFPCILRYLLMGKGDHKGDSWEKCPLCFMMISSRDLCTIQIENVKQFHVGDNVHFTLLTRLKDSLVPSLKNNQEEGSLQYSSDGINDLFSKFTLTSDVEFSAREAKSDLNNWLSKAESGFIDDLERLPYVCAALEQLEERIKSWLEQLTISGSPPLKNSAITSSRSKVTNNTNKAGSNVLASTSASNHASTTALESGGRTSYSDLRHVKLDESSHTSFTHVPEHSSSSEKGLLFDEDRTSQDTTERDSYTFYQAIDGQHLILHPLNMKCLLHHYGSYDMLPPRISGEILEMETLTQSEAIRKRYRYLSHFSLTTSIQLCEIDLREILPTSSFAPFKEEIKKREKKRKQLARKEQNEKVRAEVAALSASPIFYDQNYSPPKEAKFSSDDFEALGNSVVPSTSPPTNGERKKFSDVTRLGFAAAHDSPTLRAEGSSDLLRNTDKIDDASDSQGQRSTSTALSFANITSSAKATGNPAAQNTNNVLGKKGKKQTKVLLSTAGGRRY
ncbi:RING finger protein 10 [Asparagus officinalis]|nr:RING finger protein 10 [Asparagus officinalis]